MSHLASANIGRFWRIQLIRSFGICRRIGLKDQFAFAPPARRASAGIHARRARARPRTRA